MTLEVGEAAPGFTLQDQHGRRTSLEAFRGERSVALVFFPFAFSGVCTGELGELRGLLPAIGEAGGAVLAVSCDPMFALRRYADEDGLDFPLLSDFWPHGEVCRAYGVFDEARGCPTRSTYLIDAGGTVRWSVHNEIGVARDGAELVRQVESLHAASAAG